MGGGGDGVVSSCICVPKCMAFYYLTVTPPPHSPIYREVGLQNGGGGGVNFYPYKNGGKDLRTALPHN